jgi:hypothetical protein
MVKYVSITMSEMNREESSEFLTRFLGWLDDHREKEPWKWRAGCSLFNPTKRMAWFSVYCTDRLPDEQDVEYIESYLEPVKWKHDVCIQDDQDDEEQDDGDD